MADGVTQSIGYIAGQVVCYYPAFHSERNLRNSWAVVSLASVEKNFISQLSLRVIGVEIAVETGELA